jgi:hypothetical protein
VLFIDWGGLREATTYTSQSESQFNETWSVMGYHDTAESAAIEGKVCSQSCSMSSVIWLTGRDQGRPHRSAFPLYRSGDFAEGRAADLPRLWLSALPCEEWPRIHRRGPREVQRHRRNIRRYLQPILMMIRILTTATQSDERTAGCPLSSVYSKTASTLACGTSCFENSMITGMSCSKYLGS